MIPLSPVCIIPAQVGSTRFPNKPLALIAGHSLIERVWRIGCQAMGKAHVFVATDCQDIADHVTGFGGKAVITSKRPINGTERVLEAATILGLPEEVVVINLQGDAVLTPPWTLTALAEACLSDDSISYATLATTLSLEGEEELFSTKKLSPSSGTLVVCDVTSRALYFSKAVIPYRRSGKESSLPLKRHIGTYAYKVSALRTLCALPPTPCELAEGLEQLRVLEHGLTMQVVAVDYRGRTHASIDAPSDVALVEALIEREGELVDFLETTSSIDVASITSNNFIK